MNNNTPGMHQQHAETAIDHLVAARNAAHAADDQRAVDAYTTAIQKISRITDCIRPTGQIIAEYHDHPGTFSHEITTTRDRYPATEHKIHFTDGSTITARITGGHGTQHTLDGRRHEWTTTGPAALEHGALQIDENSHRDLDLRAAIKRAAIKRAADNAAPK